MFSLSKDERISSTFSGSFYYGYCLVFVFLLPRGYKRHSLGRNRQQQRLGMQAREGSLALFYRQGNQDAELHGTCLKSPWAGSAPAHGAPGFPLYFFPRHRGLGLEKAGHSFLCNGKGVKTSR